jgi:hypothetical protein
MINRNTKLNLSLDFLKDDGKKLAKRLTTSLPSGRSANEEQVTRSLVSHNAKTLNVGLIIYLYHECVKLKNLKESHMEKERLNKLNHLLSSQKANLFFKNNSNIWKSTGNKFCQNGNPD